MSTVFDPKVLREEIAEIEIKFGRYSELEEHLLTRRRNLLYSMNGKVFNPRKVRRLTKVEKELERLVKTLRPALMENLRVTRRRLDSVLTQR